MSQTHRGRGATLNPDNRFAAQAREQVDDGWETAQAAAPVTTISFLPAKSIITHNESPDIRFSASINPYQGCEHGCIYCYARPSHAYWGYSAGLDFETKLIAKPNAPALLREALAKPGYRPIPICLGSNTDVYQPMERELKLTRSLLEILAEARHPLYILTKNALIERDIDLLADMARDNLVQIMVSITTLDKELARCMEPRASQPLRRMESVARLHAAGVPVGVLVSPIIPALNDHELEKIMAAAAEAGANMASYVVLRLPHELKTLFEDWLETHYPARKAHVLSVLRQMRGGRDNDPNFGSRMRGSGVFADLLSKRYALALQRYGLFRQSPPLNDQAFVKPNLSGQMSLF